MPQDACGEGKAVCFAYIPQTQPAAAVERLDKLMRLGDALEVARMRPFALAEIWRAERTATLQLFLQAAVLDIVQLRWELICPSCRTAVASATDLQELVAHDQCQLCEIKLAQGYEDAIEAVFAPNPALRSLNVGVYCMGSPARAPHVLAQAILPSEGSAQLKAPMATGSYHLFVRGGADATIKVAFEAPPSLRLRTDQLSNSTVTQVAPGGTIELHNPQPRAMHAKLERFDFANTATPARAVLNQPLYQKHFRAPLQAP
ncbi:MAG: hypothetical protein EOO40_05875 [Deltaproteobacteria bacterium]|nr:MAG: hypothetical protein EOO40_05875 [Deltaproteobacteria bacterium]